MGQVEQILVHQQVVAPVEGVTRGAEPFAVIAVIAQRDGSGIRAPRLPHPDPEPLAPLHGLVPADAEPEVTGHAGCEDAGTRPVVGEAVISTLDRVALEVTLRQAEAAVRAPVVQHDGRAVLGPEVHERVVEDGDRAQFAPDLRPLGDHIPGVPDQRPQTRPRP